MIDLFIRNVAIVTMDDQRQVFVRGALAIDQGKILAVGPVEHLEGKYPARQVIEAEGMAALPGLVNTHMHLPQVLMRGVYDNIAAMDKLKHYTWPIQGHYSPDDALCSARLGLLEMIKAGTTAFISTGLHPRYGMDAIVQATLDSGMRAAISKYVMDLSAYALDNSALHPGMWETGEESKRQALELIEKWQGAGEGRLQIWISPRSVGGCSVELLRWAADTARRYHTGLTAHWSEVQNNVEYTLKTYGLRPIFFAEQVRMLGPDVTLAHGIYLDEAEISLLARTGTNIAHCPACNAKLAMGTARVPEMLRAGVNLTLANDGMGVNNTADMLLEMRSMLLLQRAVWTDPCYPTAADALTMATRNGAAALLQGDQVGSLEAGKEADLILVNLKQPHLTPVHDLVSALVWAADGRDVDTTIVAGRVLMQGRKVLTMDEKAVIADAEGRKERILAQAGVSRQRTW